MNQPELPNNKENLPDQEKVNSWMKEVIDLLEVVWGVKNLSNSELFIIRKITKDVIHRENPKSDWGFQIGREIATKFLVEAYGLDPYIIGKQTETDKDMEGFLEYIKRLRRQAHLL